MFGLLGEIDAIDEGTLLGLVFGGCPGGVCGGLCCGGWGLPVACVWVLGCLCVCFWLGVAALLVAAEVGGCEWSVVVSALADWCDVVC